MGKFLTATFMFLLKKYIFRGMKKWVDVELQPYGIAPIFKKMY